MTRKADRDQIRRQNRGVILQALRRGGPMARIELGYATGLSPATVTAITSDLIAEGLVVGWAEPEPDTRVSGRRHAPPPRGRPRTLLALDPRAADVLGVKISLGNLGLILADFSGNHVAQETLAIDTVHADAAGLVRLVIDHIKAFLARHAAGRAPLAEIVVAAQGFVDARAGTVVWSPAFSVGHVPLVGPLTRAFGVPCRLSNDANMIAEALHGSDPLRYAGTFAAVFIGYGVGMGLYVEDRLFTGESGAAAELGHANHIPGGRLCRCGKRGCLEAYLGDYGILRAAAGLPDDHDPWTLAVGDNDVAALVARADAGEAAARTAFAEAGRALGFGLARLIALLDLRLVALTGSGMRAFAHMRPTMEAALDEALVADLRHGVAIEPHGSGEDLIAAGIVSGALRRLDRDTFARPRERPARPQRMEADL